MYINSVVSSYSPDKALKPVLVAAKLLYPLLPIKENS